MTEQEFAETAKAEKLLYLFREVERIKAALNIKDTKPVVKPATWSNTTLTDREWKPIAAGDKFWTDERGNSRSRDEVPEDVILKWEASKEAAGETD
jgi:hypothetical protein